MWSGSQATIPAGWALCDGSQGTPNLSGKFIRGTSPGQNPSDGGGSTSHTHVYKKVPQHKHDITDKEHSHSIPNNIALDFSNSYGGSFGAGPIRGPWGTETTSKATGITSTDNGGVVDPSTESGEHLPPYYYLAYIMKL